MCIFGEKDLDFYINRFGLDNTAAYVRRQTGSPETPKNMAADVNGDQFNIKQLIEHIRSEDETERKITISQIPSLVLKSLRNNDKIIDQLLLVIYNLNTDSENHELLNAGNSTLIVRHLLRLYVDTIQDEKHELGQVNSLIGLVDLVHSSDLLVEIAYVLYKCSQSLEEGHDHTVAAIDQALGVIEDRATASLHPEALLMIHSIKAMR